MSHQIETFEDGTAAFFTNREPAWHRLGTVTDGAQTAQDALELAQLDWEVIKSDDPISVPVITNDGVQNLALDGKFMTYRNHPKTGLEALGVVGNVYWPLQNSEAFAFLNMVADESGAVFETAGSLDGGKRVFMTMKMPETMQIGGEDAVDSYLLAWNSHDGSTPFGVATTKIRVVCQNTLTWALNAKETNRKTFRHTKTIEGRVQQAREALALSFKSDEVFQHHADALISREMNEREFRTFVSTALLPDLKGKNVTENMVRNLEAKRSSIVGLFNAPTQDNIAGTRWAAYNAVTEYESWLAPTRGGESSSEQRARRDILATTEGNGWDLSRKAMGLLVAAN